ncbi:MAG: MotA/TolQ/ExbB proton channel family protein [Burkholderiales bacterium]|nr:MotA/TolQ/ExbB proton channel family protein [Burkholderiales bacterium]
MSLLKLVRAPFLAAAIALLGTLGAAQPALAQASAPEASSAPAADVAPVAAPAPVPAPEVKKETVDNPYGLEAMWRDGDWVTKGTAVIMVIMSMGSWYIIFTKLFEQQKILKSARGTAGFWEAGSIKKGIDTLEEGSAFRYMAEQGINASEHHEGTLVENIDLHTWISMSVQRAVGNITSRLQDGLAFLATVGSTAPFVGLFGTVWGIYHALTAIGLSGNASIEKVAGPVGEALIMTAFGLAVAVPAVMGYNWLIRRNKTVMEKVNAFSGDLHNVLLAGKK